jgi:hypothetical protein
MTDMKTFVLPAFVLCSCLATAQDMVITLRNDTLKGKAQIQTYDKIDRVEIHDGKMKNQFTAIEVKSLVIGKDIYHPVRTPERFQLMKLITPGYLSLYLGRALYKNNYDDLYLVKRNGESQEVPNLAFKKTMGNFLDDCLTIKQWLKDGDLGTKDLNKIIAEYNACLDRQTEDSIKPVPASAGDPKMIALTNLRSKIISEMNNPKDALEMLDDITDKVRNYKPLPNYLLDGLKDMLKEQPACQSELNEVMKLLKTP